MATISKRGDRWQARVRRKGGLPTSHSFRLKADAEKWAAQVEVDGERGGFSTNRSLLEATTLADLIKRYRDTVVPRHKSSLNETAVLNAFLRHPTASLRLSELGPAHFAAYRDERLKRAKPGTIIRELGLIQHALEVARKEWGIPIAANPVKGITKPKADRPRDRRLQEGEWALVQQSFEACRNPYIEAVVRFAIETGMRRGEILRAKWCDINRAEGTLHIPITKNGHPRTIPLTPGAQKILEGIAGEHKATDLVFPVSCEAIKLVWQRLVRRAGIANLRFHDLRHEAVSRFFEMGLSVPEVALISGHKDPRMLFRYTHLRAADLVAKLAAISFSHDPAS